MVLFNDIVHALSGAWILLNNTMTTLEGDPVPEEEIYLGSHPVGILTYHPSGFMSANLASTILDNRPEGPTFPPKDNQSAADWALVGKETLAYAGPVSAKEGSTTMNGTLIHGPLTVANIPSMVGTQQLRDYTVTVEDMGCGTNKTTLLIRSKDKASRRISILHWEKMA